MAAKRITPAPARGVILKKSWVSGKYLKSNGAMATGWTTVGKKTYYFNSNGTRKTGWVKRNKKYYYFSKGVLQKKKWIGKKYVTSSGARASGFTKIGKSTYYFKPSTGTKMTGWVTVSGKRYFLNKNGVLQKGRWLWSKNYYASKDGSVLKGLNAVGGKLYYFNTSTGKKLTKTKKKVSGYYYYFTKSGAAAKSTWVKIGSKYYYFKSTGKMATNTWVGKYYVDKTGARTGLKKTTGWSTVNGTKYYFDSKGNMVTGFQTIGGQKYYFTSTGAMLTGLQTIGSNRYYFYSDGVMATSVTVIVGNKEYTINSSGVVTKETSLSVSEPRRGSQIAKFALNFVGNPYVYGGTSLTNGADCSGFVQTVFSNYGIKVPRVANDQMNGKGGVSVDIASIQPGDLLFYGSGNYASHVAIYIGNKQIVHASNSQPYPRGGIKISAYNYDTPIKAVRYWS